MASQQVPEESTSTATCSNMEDIDHDVSGYDSILQRTGKGSKRKQTLKPKSDDEDDTASNTTSRSTRFKLFGSAVEGITVWKTVSSEVLFDNDVVNYFHLSQEDLPSCTDSDYHIMDLFEEAGNEGEMDAPYVHLHLCTPKCEKVTFNKKVMCIHVNNIKEACCQHLINENIKNL